MRKKVKSFAAEEESHDKLSTMFKANYVDVTLSSCLNKYIKELLTYLETIEEGIQSSSYTIPMAFVIETVTREPIFRVLESSPRPEEAESSLERELDELQKKYDAHIKRNPSAAIDFAKTEVEEVPISVVLAFVAKGLLKQIKNRRDLTDEEWVELVRNEGGKELQKYIRETIGPFLDRIDPDMGEVIKRIRKALGQKIDMGE